MGSRSGKDCSLVKNVFRWESRWNIETAIEKIIDWNDAYFTGKSVKSMMEIQINEYLG